MARALDRRTLALPAANLAALAIFALDLFSPPALAIWTLYVAPLFAVAWLGRKRDVYITAAFSAALIYAGYYFAPAEQRMSYALANRLLEIAIVLALAAGMGRRIDARRELLRQHSRLKRLLDERNDALEALMTQQRQGEEERSQLAEQLASARRNAALAAWPVNTEERAAAQAT